MVKRKLAKIWKKFGPGLITGASDDDPSGIATYTQAGSRFGTQLLWTAVITYPLIVAIQEMCARIGLVTGKGLTGVIKEHYPRYILYVILTLSLPSIILNIGADIAAMGVVANLLIPDVPAFLFSIIFTLFLIYAIINWNYRKIANALKYLCLVLLCYLIIPFLIRTNWRIVIRDTFFPTFGNNPEFYLALVGILGTTISPYLFFWQASMEAEEVHQKHLVVDKRIISDMETDVSGGLLFTNLVFYFIVLTSATVLYNSGIRDVETVEQAASALKPLAGNMAYLLFAIGVIGTGLLAIPVLAGSLSYMIAEIFNWKEGLDKEFSEARGFYIAMILSLATGLIIHFLDFSPIQALIYTAVLYGCCAPILIALILHICNNKTIMGHYCNTTISNILALIALILMTSAVIALLYITLT